MKLIELVVLLGFGLPIFGLSALFVSEARRMMRIEAARAEIRQANARARRYEAMRRKARGTPRRPGGYAIR